MWIICDVGFFNVVCQDGDAENGLLTVKARSRNDLKALEDFIPFDRPIEESDEADYRYRRKAKKHDVIGGFQTIMREIDYPKTKPKLMERHPDRQLIYFRVWDELYTIQVIDEAKKSLRSTS